MDQNSIRPISKLLRLYRISDIPFAEKEGEKLRSKTLQVWLAFLLLENDYPPNVRV